MSSDKPIETRGHIVGFKEKISQAAQSSENDFFVWFDKVADKDIAFVRGHWDFALHIAAPLAKYISQPETKTALDLGYGGGRILAAAAKSFKQVIGIDIHQQRELVTKALNERGINNFALQQTDGRTILLNDDSVDVVYSFIVLQHVEKIAIFESYLDEVYRILKPNGVALLYFGRKYILSLKKSLALLYWIDRMLEPVTLPKGYLEFPAGVNDTNLQISLGYARKSARARGFQVLDTVVSRKKVPDGVRLYGGQHGLILKK